MLMFFCLNLTFSRSRKEKMTWRKSNWWSWQSWMGRIVIKKPFPWSTLSTPVSAWCYLWKNANHATPSCSHNRLLTYSSLFFSSSLSPRRFQPDGEDDLKKRQLMELAIINGTYRDTTKPSAAVSQASASSRKLWDVCTAAYLCAVFGFRFHFLSRFQCFWGRPWVSSHCGMSWL